ncbi:MAG: response regulator [Chthoniobacteraceae bacterium]
MKAILVVDDYSSLGEMIAAVLRGSGYRVLTASSGESALRLLPKKGGAKIDLLLTDYEMPLMRGDELARRFHDALPDGRVVMMSSAAPQADSPRWCEFLAKPFHVDVLLSKVESALTSGGKS